MSEITEYLDGQLRSVEALVGRLRYLSVTGHCDSTMTGAVDWLADEVLFLRAALHKHPPYIAPRDEEST